MPLLLGREHAGRIGFHIVYFSLTTNITGISRPNSQRDHSRSPASHGPGQPAIN